jgi:hypothetical protein
MAMGTGKKVRGMFCFLRLGGIWIDGWGWLMLWLIRIARQLTPVAFLPMLVVRLSWAILGGIMLDLLLGYLIRLLYLVVISILNRFYFCKDLFNILRRYIWQA